MQYKENAFGINGRVTIETVDSAFQKKIGQRKTLFKLDLEDLNKYFNCKGDSFSNNMKTLIMQFLLLIFLSSYFLIFSVESNKK